MNWPAKLSIALLLTLFAIFQTGCDSRIADKPLGDSQADGIQPVQLTDANFHKEVIESDLPVMVDMWAPWCGPCIEMKPTIRLLAVELAGQVKVAELNIEENPFITEKYAVDRYPTLLIFVDGEEVERLVGKKALPELKSIVDDAIEQQIAKHP